jgi:hypothetical protein
MAPALVVHHRDQQAVYAEHPTEVARKALLAAAEVETRDWASILERVASSLPRRPAIMKGGES